MKKQQDGISSQDPVNGFVQRRVPVGTPPGRNTWGGSAVLGLRRASTADPKLISLAPLGQNQPVHPVQPDRTGRSQQRVHKKSWLALGTGLLAWTLLSPALGAAWKLRTIDNSSRGADGVRFLDVNGDKRQDIATGWEEGGIVRAYLHPGSDKVHKPWPAVTVGKVASPEDAVFVDLDNDGRVDIVSSCEGRNRRVHVHWAPKNPADYLDPEAWQTGTFPATVGRSWMFALPMDIDGRHGTDIVLGSKGSGASIAWLQAPENPRDLAAWKLHTLRKSSWLMTLRAEDMDGDGDPDILASDRMSRNAKVLWLENPGQDANRNNAPWKEHTLGARGRQVMFIDFADLDGDGRKDVVIPCRPRDILILYQPETPGQPWEEQTLTFPAEKYGTAKGVRVADLDNDGKLDIAATCEHANGQLSGCFYLSFDKSPRQKVWKDTDIGGPLGVKYDRIELLDVDGDGDLDLFSCEEQDQLGVFWYENPTDPSF